ncbi:MAG: AsmA-like C-terminal domain-containing protein [Alphaproteobacteria bacterium]
MLIARTSKIALQFVAAVVVGIGLLAGVVAWQLGRGPMSLDFLTPYIEDELTDPDAPARVRLGRTVLLWAGLERALDVRVLDLRLVGEDGRVFASVPEASVRFSLRALLAGVVAPTSIELLGPRLKLVRREDGVVDLGIDGSEGRDEAADAEAAAAIARLLEGFYLPPAEDRSVGWLTRIAVDSGFLTVDDRRNGVVWMAPRVTFGVDRDARGLVGEGTFVVEQGDLRGRFEVSARWAHGRGLELGLGFADMPPAMLAAIEPLFAPLGRIDLPLTGTLAATLGPDLAPEGLTFDLAGGAGTLSLPEFYKDRLAVTALALRGRIEVAAGRLVVDEAMADLGGPAVSLKAEVVHRGDELDLRLDGEARAVRLDELARYWPEDLGAVPREWVTGNLKQGTVDVARLHLAGTAPAADPTALAIRELGGDMAGAGITVHFLRPMEPVRDVRARAVFDADSLTVTADAGEMRGMRLQKATIDIRGLASPPGTLETIDIAVDVAGGIRPALEVIDQKPLGYASALGFAPSGISGRQRTQVTVKFPLIARLRFADIDVRAEAKLEDVAIEHGPLGQPVAGGSIALSVDPKSLVAAGALQLGPVPMVAKWSERLGSGGGPRRQYEASFALDAAQRRALGINVAPWLDGKVFVRLQHAVADDARASGSADIDLSEARLALAPFDWSKPPGTPGRARARWDVAGERLSALPEISIDAGGLVAAGAATFAADATAAWPSLKRLTVSRFSLPGTDVAGGVVFGGDRGPEIELSGRELDLRGLVERFEHTDDGDGEPLVVRIAPAAPIGRVRLGEETVMANVSGTLELGAEAAHAAHVRATLPGGGDFTLDLDRAGADRRALTINSNDAGVVLHALDWSDNVKGGRLKVVGHFDDKLPGRPLDAVASIEDFVLLDGPALARLITLVSPIGIVDALSGPGIGFSRLEVPLQMTPEKITLRDARARGADLGILANGTITRGSGTLDMRGEIAPVRTLNALLGNIPIIGTLLTGGGEGIFAWTWSAKGTVDDPDFSVNPLSVLTPGFTRRIIEGLGDVSDTEIKDQHPQEQQQQ